MPIRKFTPADLESYSELLLKTNPWDTKENIERLLSDKDLDNCFVIENAGKIIGGIIFEISPNELYIDWLDVGPDHQGVGLGSKLLQIAIDNAKNHKITHITAQVAQNNHLGNTFFTRHGFQLDKTIENGIKSGVDANIYNIQINTT